MATPLEYGTHQTKLYLTRVSWDNSYTDTKLFSDSTEQFNYFYNLGDTFKGFERDNSTFRFLDGDGTNARKRDLKVSLRPENAQTYNYAFYSNDNGNTWHYMFINSADYINYETALLHLEEDLLQSYMFNYSLLPCEIERETVASDTFANCLEPDYLPCDNDFYANTELLIGKKQETTGVLPYICCKKYALYDRATHPTTSSAYEIRQQPFFRIDQATFPYSIIVFEDMAQLQSYKKVLEKTLFSARETWEPEYFDMRNIISYGLISKELIRNACVIDEGMSSIADNVWIFQNENGSGLYLPVKSWGDLGWTTTMSIRNVGELYRQTGYTVAGKPLFAEYTPNNKKLLCSPYSNITIETPGETLNEIKPENVFQPNSEVVNVLVRYTFEDTFKCYGTIKYMNIRPDALSQNYKNYSSLIEVPIATTMPGDIDNYWQYVNGINAQRSSRLLQGTLSGTVSAMTGNYASIAANVVGEATSEISEFSNSRMHHGVTQVGTIGGNMFLLGSSLYPRVCLKQVDPRYITKIDEYFSKYGYKVSYRGVPNLYSREKWNYVKTNGCKISPKAGTLFMNNDAKIAIQNIYDKGIRFWHGNRTPGSFGNYDNPIKTNTEE